VETLFARIGAAEGDERAQLVQELVSALRVHMELEETHVYPLLQQEVDVELAEEAEVEHQLARDGVAQLEELTPEEPGFDAALVMVISGIEHHVMEEENEVFPRLATALGAEHLPELAEQLTAARAKLLSGQGRSQGDEDQAASARGAKSQSEKPTDAKAKDNQAPRPPRPRRTAGDTPRHRRTKDKVNPDDTTRADLIAQAKKAGVPGYSHMSKAELAKALSRA